MSNQPHHLDITLLFEKNSPFSRWRLSVDRSCMEAHENGQTNEAMLLPSDDVGFLAILGEFWSWEHPQPTSKGRNLSEAKDMAAQMTTKSLLK